MASFLTLRRYLAPRWLTEGEGELAGYALDLVKNAFMRRVELGAYARIPQNDPTGATTAPPDALEAMGRDRRVVRGMNESAQSYAARLRLWLDDRKRAGNPFALLQKLAEYTGPGPRFRTVDARGNWYTRGPDGSESAVLRQENWNWDGDDTATRWSRFWVILYPLGLWTPSAHAWGDATGPGWGADKTGSLGSTAPHDAVATVRFIVNDWKPAGTRCVNIIVAFDPDSFDPGSPEPDGLWHRWSKNVNGMQVPARLATARYWDGV